MAQKNGDFEGVGVAPLALDCWRHGRDAGAGLCYGDCLHGEISFEVAHCGPHGYSGGVLLPPRPPSIPQGAGLLCLGGFHGEAFFEFLLHLVRVEKHAMAHLEEGDCAPVLLLTQPS